MNDQPTDTESWRFNQDPAQSGPADDFDFAASMGMDMGGVGSSFTWEMIGLGLDEPLPPQDIIDELYVSAPLDVAADHMLICG